VILLSAWVPFLLTRLVFYQFTLVVIRAGHTGFKSGIDPCPMDQDDQNLHQGSEISWPARVTRTGLGRVRTDAHSSVVLGYEGADNLSVATYDVSESEENNEDETSLAESTESKASPGTKIHEHPRNASDETFHQASLGGPRPINDGALASRRFSVIGARRRSLAPSRLRQMSFPRIPVVLNGKGRVEVELTVDSGLVVDGGLLSA
jgi:hypothetical protein